MKKFLSFTLLFISGFVFSQNIEFAVIVKDVETGLPIPEVTITSLKTKQGFLTNTNGEANISLSKESDLQFENSSYKTYIVKYLDLDKKINEVYLESNAKRLEEVILTSEHPQDILRKLIKNSLDKITIPVNLKVYLREFYKKNDQIVFFNDGLINFQIAGNSRNIKTDILVEQNRAVGLLDSDINEELLGYNLNNIIENYYQFQYLEEILASGAKRKYDFQIKSYPNNENFLVITAVPLEESSNVFSEFTIIYERNKMVIMEVSSMVPDSRLEDLRQSFLKNSKIYKLEFKNTFRIENDLYYLANSKEVIGFEKKYKDQSRRIEVNNHMIITNFDKELFKYNDKNVFKDKSLINKKSSFFTDYWDFESGFVSTKEEKDIIERLSHL
ncbi:hypothetical protein SAMN05660845_0924 [Flavobacterium swingsii]|jgi:hypothetical protein|uniref:CarboxypepD_reg-like domain-containing protein n=1 Tax=Flavobacterium swingsii TaxID=498292 RepID=A0A1I0WS14_9FLAO|nr:hypothetical protein [Flavobacterium swingsii]SFA90978.1 hypothetical protein SAMN05660845_0924 [Flavobacterium swingsii]